MNACDLVRRLHDHRRWVNRQLLSIAAELEPEQLTGEFQIGQGSIWKSLLHMYAAEYVWLEALQGNEEPLVPGDLAGRLPGNQGGENPIASPAELAAKWAQLDGRWQEYLEKLRPEDLDEVVYKTSTSTGFGQRYGTRRSDVLLHVCTHAQYTTAQVVNMLRHVGAARLPEPMLIALARLESAG